MPRPLHTEQALDVCRPELKLPRQEGATVLCRGGSRTYYISDGHIELCRLNLSGRMPLESGRMLALTPLSPCMLCWEDGELILDAFNTVLVPAALEGVCEDGSQITLDDYRGKRVLLCLNHNPIQPDGTFPLVEKYLAEGLEVVLYNGYNRRNAFVATDKFKQISRVRTRANPELGGRRYVDLMDYYGLGFYSGSQVALIGADGSVVAMGNSVENIMDDLKSLFPEGE